MFRTRVTTMLKTNDSKVIEKALEDRRTAEKLWEQWSEIDSPKADQKVDEADRLMKFVKIKLGGRNWHCNGGSYDKQGNLVVHISHPNFERGAYYTIKKNDYVKIYDLSEYLKMLERLNRLNWARKQRRGV